VATGLVFLVFLILVYIVIPLLSPDKAPGAKADKVVSVFWILFIIHSVLALSLIYKILDSQRGGLISKDLIVAVGIVLIFFALTMSDGAFAYLEYSDPGKRTVAIALFICVGFNLIAGVMTFVIARHSQRLKHLFHSEDT